MRCRQQKVRRHARNRRSRLGELAEVHQRAALADLRAVENTRVRLRQLECAIEVRDRELEHLLGLERLAELENSVLLAGEWHAGTPAFAEEQLRVRQQHVHLTAVR